MDNYEEQQRQDKERSKGEAMQLKEKDEVNIDDYLLNDQER